MNVSLGIYDTCFILFKYFGGRNIARIEREMRGLGHTAFHRRILYSRTENGTRKPGWIERFGWRTAIENGELRIENRRTVGNVELRTEDSGSIPASIREQTRRNAIENGELRIENRRTVGNVELRTEDSGSIPASIQEQTKFEKKAILNSQFSSLNSSFHAWLKSVSPGMTWDWRHQLHIIEQIEKVTSGECKRLMIFLPPRHGKSELVTVRYSAWRMQQDPSMNIILGSYNQRLADRFSRKVRKVIIDAVAIENGELRIENCDPPRRSASSGSVPVKQRQQHNDDTILNSQFSTLNSPAKAGSMFPFASSKPANSVSEWETAAGGGFRAVGVGGGVTGFGAQLIVIDDPVKSRAEAESETYRENVWDWFNDDLYTRLEPDGAMILIQTRWHEDDLAGRLLREMHEGGEHWDVIDLPAIAEGVSTAETPRRREMRQQKSEPGAVATGFFSVHSVPSVVPSASTTETTKHTENTENTEQEKTPRLGVSAVQISADPLGREPGQALCPERFDEITLEKIKRKLGTYSFSALYQQRPTPSDGGTFKREWFRRIIPYAPAGLKWKRGYDLAVSTRTNADYTASFRCAFDEAGNLYIAGGFRKRIEFPEQRRFVIERILAEPDTEHGIELALHGQALIQDLRREPGIRGHSLRGVKVETDKLTRALAWAPLAEEGKVILVRNGQMENGQRTMENAGKTVNGNLASGYETIVRSPFSIVHWIDDFLDEVCAFPNGHHDDQIDAVSLAVQMLKQRRFGAMGF